MKEQQSSIFLSLFVACYNEAKNIFDTLVTLKDALSQFSFNYEIIIIDDASSDNSVDIIRQFIKANPDMPLQLIIREKNTGLARNYLHAAKISRGIWYRLICGDNVEKVTTLIDIFKHIGKADIILPYHIECRGRSLYRRLLSRSYTFLINISSGYKIKYYNGLAVHRLVYIQRLHSSCRGFGFQADLITRLLDKKLTYLEVPVIAHERTFGKSSALTYKNLLSVIHTLLKVWMRRLRKYYYSFGLKQNTG